MYDVAPNLLRIFCLKFRLPTAVAGDIAETLSGVFEEVTEGM